MGGLQPLPVAALPSAWIKEAVTRSPALISVLRLSHRLDKKDPFQQHGSACHGSPSVAADFLRLCSRELSCLFWIWWIVLCGFMTGTQMLKYSVVRPQNLSCIFLHWVISLLHLGCFQSCFPAIHLYLVRTASDQIFVFISDLEEGLLRFLSSFFSPHAFYLKTSFGGFIFMWRHCCSSICKSHSCPLCLS